MMDWLEDLFERPLKTILIGATIVVVAPIAFPVLGAGLRPAAKSIIRGYLAMSGRAKELVAEAKEQVSDLVAEAKATEVAAETSKPVSS
jgi:hypothetical protein